MSRARWVPSKRRAPFRMSVVCILGLVSAAGAQTSKLVFGMGGGGYEGGLYVMDMAPGSTPVFLTVGKRPDWSPDGTEIVYERHDVEHGARHYVDIWIIGADGSNPREILRQERVQDPKADVLPSLYAPAWSPDGSVIGVPSDGACHFVRPDGVAASRIYIRGGVLDWTPDSRHIVYASHSEGEGIAILEADGIRGIFGRRGVIYDKPTARVQVSPDGRQIAFAVPEDPESGKNVWQVRVMDVDGSNERFLVEGRSPCWSPDSRQIAFIELDEAEWPHALKVINVDGSDPRTLLGGPDSDLFFLWPAWSPQLPAETATPASSWGQVKDEHRSR